MNKKQKKMLTRIIIAAVLMIAFKVIGTFVDIPTVILFIMYMVPYLVIGYDILRKAIKGILNRQVFDENFLMAVATVGFVLSGLTTSYSLICLSSVIKGIGFGCGGATMFGCLQDAITYGEWYNGYGTAGMGNAASSFCMKVGSGIGTAALGWILAAGGFDAQLKVQSASALSSISIAFAWVPVITCVICVICMAFFNVDKYYAKVVEDLSQGKHRGE